MAKAILSAQTYIPAAEYKKVYYGEKPFTVPGECHRCKKEGHKVIWIKDTMGRKLIVIARQLSVCSSCKAVEYCSTKCQLDDWKGVGTLPRVAGSNSHKRECPWYKESMGQWPQVRAIQALFPWSADLKSPRERPWILNQVELLLGLKGDGAVNGYWQEPAAASGIHDSNNPYRVASPAYICHGSMLLRAALPVHTGAWTLPTAHIPLLELDDADAESRIPALHDSGAVRDWATWYEWRKLPRESPVALRMDVVLTVYHLLTAVLGVVATSPAATTSRRTLVVHFVGAEKELNIVPLFSELALLIPNSEIILTFFGPACKTLCDIAAQKYPAALATKSTVFEYTAPAALGGSTLRVKIDGRENYGLKGTDDMPDSLAENAGLFAYMTWQIVYNYAARKAIPWGITEYHMDEALEYEGHMVQWRDLALHGCEISVQRGMISREELGRKLAALEAAQARGAGVNPFMRPGLMESHTLVPRAYNGFVLRVC
ncbi:hypothetical protein DFH09DRAFT_1329468 [Mycena vulgaris]|nr:hypothetical protein DFH09DRAFT_1329468 [Mycena vulgaris]